MTSRLPLPRGYFQCQPLSVQDVAQFKTQAMTMVMDVIRNVRIQGGPFKWELLSDESDLKIYKFVDGNAALHCGVLEVVGTIDEAVELFRTDSSDLEAEYHSRFNHDQIDTAVLCSILDPRLSDTRERNDISWSAFKSSFKSLSSSRDMCVLTCHHEFELDGKRGWVQAYKSVELECCSNMKASHGLVRTAHNGSGYVFIESNRPGYLLVSYISNINTLKASNSPEWGTDPSAIKRCRNLVDIDRFLRENRLSATPFLSKSQLVPVSSRRICFLCRKKFGSFGRKTNCFKCGEVMCTSCNHNWRARMNGKPTKVRVCTKCSSGSVAIPQQQMMSNNFQNLNGIGGLSGIYAGDIADRPSRQSTMSVDTDFSMFRESFASDATFDMNDTSSRSRTDSLPRVLYQEQWDHLELDRRAKLLQQTQPEPEPIDNTLLLDRFHLN